jgi:hypothetical protein
VAVIAPGYKPVGATTSLQDTLNMPIINNILGRWIKVTDYGTKEEMMSVSANIDRTKAQESLQRREAVDNAVKEYAASDKSMSSKWRIQKQLVKTVNGNDRSPEAKVRGTNLEKQFKLGVMKNMADPNIDALIYAGTNDEKVQLLSIIKKGMDDKEFNTFTRLMIKEKVMSNDVLIKYKKIK